MSISIGILAAHELIANANIACKKTALALKDVGVQLGVPWDEASWSFCQAVCSAAKPETEPNTEDFYSYSIERLAERRLHGEINECLKDLCKKTEPLKNQVTNGVERWTQYEEGLITETEYLTSLIDAVSHQ